MAEPVPEWVKNRIFLVDPSIWSRYRRGRSDLRPVHDALVEALRSIGIEPHVLTRSDRPVDIWIRDWGFVEGAYFKFAPAYAKHLYSPSTISAARAALDQQTGTPRRSIPLILDGGNLIHNGGVAILTEKVLADNPHFSRLEIERVIVSLGFNRVM